MHISIKQFFLSAIFFIYTLNFFAQDTTDYNSPKFTKAEKKEIRKANTAKLRFYMWRQSREFIKMMNLCRTNGPLFYKYVKIKYGDEYASRAGFTAFKSTRKRKCSYLRPSFTLWLSGWVHAFSSGIIGYEGHQGFHFRLLLFGNFNAYVPEVMSGENCSYGFRKGINALEQLLGSPFHRKNIMEKKFCRVGVARFFHWRYGYTNVSVFTGPKLKDRIFRHKMWKTYFKD